MKVEEMRNALVDFTRALARECEAAAAADYEEWPSLWTAEDERELREWPPSLVEEVFREVGAAIAAREIDADSIWTPCLTAGCNCGRCAYGRRHGKCPLPGSDFSWYCDHVFGPLSLIEWLDPTWVVETWRKEVKK